MLVVDVMDSDVIDGRRYLRQRFFIVIIENNIPIVINLDDAPAAAFAPFRRHVLDDMGRDTHPHLGDDGSRENTITSR